MTPRQIGRTSGGEDATPAPETAPSSEVRSRHELAAFLRARRARLTPEQVGLPARRRSRTPGLRREDVAERAGISTAWYTYLEQGREIQPSREAVERIARALCLSGPDHAYLLTLTGHTPPSPGADHGLDPRLLQSLVDHVTAPAYVTDALTRVLAWNPPAREIFGDYAAWPTERRNLLRLLFTEPRFASRLVARDEYATRVVHTFRDRSDAHLKDPAAIALIEELSRQSNRFRQAWESTDVRRAGTDTLVAHHPDGRLTFTMIMLQDLGPAGLRINAYLPADPATTRAMETAGKPPQIGRAGAAGGLE
ncbi:helix-turn-helix transcriptional regulator [Streptomyces sp. WAC 06738]|uniref:helix-turn-helix transcriptional regulator n=1 Tax=Streptomyces sp. WAC 06738 TaxID=2203210 RepID=UPI0013E02B1C|nr:helix-turn-helix transcriptional regulator [Streptomyces sp. WAC 06738]